MAKAAKATRSRLEVIPAGLAYVPPQAPDGLEAAGLHLWNVIVSTFEFDDPGSYIILEEACWCRQRAHRCRLLIDRDGEVLEGGKSNPLLRDELQNRAACCRFLTMLGLNFEAIKGIGRPPGGSFA